MFFFFFLNTGPTGSTNVTNDGEMFCFRNWSCEENVKHVSVAINYCHY